MFFSRYNVGLKNSAQFGGTSNYSLFPEENTTANCSMVMVFA